MLEGELYFVNSGATYSYATVDDGAIGTPTAINDTVAKYTSGTSLEFTAGVVPSTEDPVTVANNAAAISVIGVDKTYMTNFTTGSDQIGVQLDGTSNLTVVSIANNMIVPNNEAYNFSGFSITFQSDTQLNVIEKGGFVITGSSEVAVSFSTTGITLTGDSINVTTNNRVVDTPTYILGKPSGVANINGITYKASSAGNDIIAIGGTDGETKLTTTISDTSMNSTSSRSHIRD